MNDYTKAFLDYLIAEKGYSQLTVDTYRSALTDFQNYLSELDAEQTWKTVDTDIVRRWLADRMSQGTDGRTMKKKLAALRTFFRYLMRLGVVSRDPAHLVSNPKVPKRLPQFLKESDMERLFKEITFSPDFEGTRDRLILLIFYSTGIRLSELIGLNVESVSFGRNELKVLGKRNKERIVPFGPELRDEIAAYLPLRSAVAPPVQHALIVDIMGQRMTPVGIREIVEAKLAAVTTLRKRTPHVLRHTFATVMLNNGADIRAVQELLGHEKLATTEVYTHVTFADLRKEYEKAHPREKNQEKIGQTD